MKTTVINSSVTPRNLARLIVKKATKAAARANLKGEEAQRFMLRYMAALRP